MRVRRARKEDFEQLFELEKDFCAYNNSLEKNKDYKYKLIKKESKKRFLKRVGDKNRLTLVLEDKKKLIGYLDGCIEKAGASGASKNLKKFGYANMTFMRKEYRGEGYFSDLIKAFFDYLKKKKITYCELHVDLSNKSVIKIYKRMGFKPVEYKMVAKIR